MIVKDKLRKFLHDINNGLCIISGYNDLLKDSLTNLNNNMKKYLDKQQKAVKQLATKVKQYKEENIDDDEE